MDPTIVEGNAIFTNELYQILSRKNGNVFFSPFSIHAVLSMVYQGARGDSAEAIARTLHNPDLNATATGYKSVIEYLNALEEVSLLIANKIYTHQTAIELDKDFETAVTENFRSEMELVDFDHPETAKTINDWVAKKTNDKIQNILDGNALKGQKGLVLINTICFKGDWFFQFSDAVPDKFYVEEGKTVDVQMMRNSENPLNYARNEEIGAEVVELNFVGFATQMVIVLPFEDTNVKEVEAKLATRSLTNLIKDLKRMPVVLQMPKFKIEESIQLNDVLKEMGLGVIFDPERADFGGMTQSKKLHVANVLQKAYIDVNEYGCEAAAATVVEILTTCCLKKRQEPILFKVNRPCIFMLVASERTRNKNILFYGRLSQPSY